MVRSILERVSNGLDEFDSGRRTKRSCFSRLSDIFAGLTQSTLASVPHIEMVVDAHRLFGSHK